MNEKKVETFSAFFVLLFNNTDKSWPAHSSELEDHNSGSSDFQFADTEIVRDKLYQSINPWDLVGFILQYWRI